MKNLGRYLTGIFLGRWLSTTFSMLALLSVVDSIGNADALPDGSGFDEALKYAWLRLPTLFDRVFMFALFISLLLTFLALIRRQELVSFGAAGVSPIMEIKALAGAVLALSIGSAILIDQTLPRATLALDNWLGGGALTEDMVADDLSIWIAEDDTFVRIGQVRGDALIDVKLYEREGESTISAVTSATSARYNGQAWTLIDAHTVRIDGAELPPLAAWMTPQTPSTLQKLSTSPRFLSVADQIRLTWLRNSGTRPGASYMVWALNRLTMPIVALGFLMIAVTIMQQFGRRQTGDRHLMYGLALGFGFFIIDGVLKTLAEGGGVSVTIAVGLPILILLIVAIHMVLETERA